MFWTEEKVKLLKINYPTKGIIFCSKLFNKSPVAIKTKAYKIGLKREFWSQEEIHFLKKSYPLYGLKHCANHLNKPLTNVRAKVKKFKLKKLPKTIVPNVKQLLSKQEKLLRKKERRKLWYQIPQNRLAVACRVRIRASLKGKNKIKHTEQLLGCCFINFKKYLESKFSEGMNWDNYGSWHIDHIIPCAAFDLSKPEEQVKCFHYTNLQPLWKKDNLSKGSKVLNV